MPARSKIPYIATFSLLAIVCFAANRQEQPPQKQIILEKQTATEKRKGLPILKKKSSTAKSQYTITNGVTKEHLGRKHYGRTYYPEKFVLKVNGKELGKGESMQTEQKTITVQYGYEWYIPWGNRVGAKEATFTLSDETDQRSITFDGWDAVERIKISSAQKTSQEKAIDTSAISFSQDTANLTRKSN